MLVPIRYCAINMHSKQISKDEANYVLKDEKSESKYKFRLAEALSKARSKKLLAEKTVCCLGKLDVPHVLIKRIITCSGGNVR